MMNDKNRFNLSEEKIDYEIKYMKARLEDYQERALDQIVRVDMAREIVDREEREQKRIQDATYAIRQRLQEYEGYKDE